jgi:serine/threonine protein phosphatase PrpC
MWLPKIGNSAEEYEDAFATSEVESKNSVFRCAVADGASEASFSKDWAKLLVQSFVSEKQLKDMRASFANAVCQKDLSWYAEEKLSKGSFAAYVGLSILKDRYWRAEAIGDCCLFHIHEGKVIGTFPLLSSAEFSNTPRLVSSKSDDPVELPSTVAGTWSPDDRFLLLSDALAYWLMNTMEEHEDAAMRLVELKTNQDLEEFAKRERSIESGSDLKNDDLTLMIVEITAD